MPSLHATHATGDPGPRELEPDETGPVERYQLLEPLSKRADTRVWAGLALASGQEVVIKECAPGGADAAERLDRFRRGAALLSSLNHWGVPQVRAFDQQGHLVLERLSGGTLRDRVRGRASAPSAEQVAALLEHLLEIVLYLHSRAPAVAHGAIEPDHVMFRGADDPRPVLIGFAPGGHPTSGCAAPALGYAAPEQLAGTVTPQTDLYAVGLTVVYFATGCEPHQLARRRGRWQLQRALSQLDAVTASVLTRLVEPALDQRSASAAQALVALRRRESAPPPTSPRAPARTGRTMGLVLSLILVGLILGICWGFYEREVDQQLQQLRGWLP